MRESNKTSTLLRYLRRALPDAVILKHSDQFTGGIPDFSVSMNGITSWYEVKMVQRPVKEVELLSTIRKNFITQAQLLMMERLNREAQAYYIIFFNSQITIWHPDAVKTGFTDGLKHRIPVHGVPNDIEIHGVARLDKDYLAKAIRRFHAERR